MCGLSSRDSAIISLQEEVTTDVGVILTAASARAAGRRAVGRPRCGCSARVAAGQQAGCRTFHRLHVLRDPHHAVRARAEQPHLGAIDAVLACAVSGAKAR
jgi:hypothetical protein